MKDNTGIHRIADAFRPLTRSQLRRLQRLVRGEVEQAVNYLNRVRDMGQPFDLEEDEYYELMDNAEWDLGELADILHTLRQMERSLEV